MSNPRVVPAWMHFPGIVSLAVVAFALAGGWNLVLLLVGIGGFLVAALFGLIYVGEIVLATIRSLQEYWRSH